MDYQVAERLLAQWGEGDRASLDELVGLVYHELHRMAAGVLRGEATTHRTRPTSLVNELYVELLRQKKLEAKSEEHFFSIAAFLMRQILVGQARKRNSLKRGGGQRVAELTEWLAGGGESVDWGNEPELVMALNDALMRLEEMDPVKASIVDLRFFAGLSMEATAQATGMSVSTVKRHWTVARVWLFEQIKGT